MHAFFSTVSFLRTITVIIALLLVIPTVSQAGFVNLPAIFEVTGVASNDTLNVHEHPDASSRDIGDLLPREQVEVTVFDASGKWARILWVEGNGWIARRYLAEVPQFGDNFSGMPVGLYCSGTEPFWSADITPENRFNFNRMGESSQQMSIQNSSMSLNMYGSNYAFDTPRFVGFLRRAACSDGMSELDYGWSLDLFQKGSGNLLSGCCTMMVGGRGY